MTKQEEQLIKQEMQLGKIAAVLYASESVVEYATERGVKDTVIMAKVSAYDNIVKIMKDADYVPWRDAE